MDRKVAQPHVGFGRYHPASLKLISPWIAAIPSVWTVMPALMDTSFRNWAEPVTGH